ncbi:MAG: EF-hand domain-containing protein, partial [Verrucomicrobiota bacterium]
DGNGDGTLSLAEQKAIIKKLGGASSPETPKPGSGSLTEEQLAKLLKKYPESDADGNGELSQEEAAAYLSALKTTRGQVAGGKGTFVPNPGWKEERFPDHAVCYLTPEELVEQYGDDFPNLPKSEEGVLRVVGTGHSFMAPGYRTLPAICEAAGFTQPLYTHTGGGMTGSVRYKWEQENGIFDFDKKPKPVLLPAIANAGWDVMMWGPYDGDQPEYYSAWIDYCLKYNPEMKFYLSDAWIRLWPFKGGTPPKDESQYDMEFLLQAEAEKHQGFTKFIETMREKYPDKVFITPTSLAVTKAAVLQVKGELPGVESLHKLVTGEDRSIWRDHRGHLGMGFDRLEGYVFYATLYKRSPELIENKIHFTGKSGYPSDALDKVFRKIAWEAVIENPLSTMTRDVRAIVRLRELGALRSEARRSPPGPRRSPT